MLERKEYDIQLPDRDEISSFAERWLGGSASRFLAELHRVRLDFQTTPLLLTIAAQLFERMGGVLPANRAALYDCFVDLVQVEFEQRGIAKTLPDSVSNMWRSALDHAALVMLSAQPSMAVLETALEQYVLSNCSVSRERAHADARLVASTVCAHSGLLKRIGDTVGFLHQTIHEYLAARAAVRQSASIEELWECYISKWSSQPWREVSLFCLSFIRHSPDLIEELVRRILDSTNYFPNDPNWLDGEDEKVAEERAKFDPVVEALEFLAQAISDGAPISDSLADEISLKLFRVVDAFDGDADEQSAVFDMLSLLRCHQPTIDRLRSIIELPEQFHCRQEFALVAYFSVNSDATARVKGALAVDERAQRVADSETRCSTRLDIARLLIRHSLVPEASEVICKQCTEGCSAPRGAPAMRSVRVATTPGAQSHAPTPSAVIVTPHQAS